MKFPESTFAHKYLDGVEYVVEIGASAHNPFNIKAQRYTNIDFSTETSFHSEQMRLCGEIAPVNIIAQGDELPLEDSTVDCLINSHVVEHFFDPIKAINEWIRILKPNGYILFNVPHKDRTPDKNRDLTGVPELILRNKGILSRHDYPIKDDHGHWSVWNTQSFLNLIFNLELKIIDYLDVDDKVGNGFMVLIQK